MNKPAELIKLVFGHNMSAVWRKAAEISICHEECPASKVCPMSHKEGWERERVIRYCERQLRKWWSGGNK